MNRCQRRFLDSSTGRDLILKARQQGFTTIGLVWDLWHFLTRQSANVRILCQTQTEHDALNDIARKFRVILASIEEHCVLPWAGKPTHTHWELATGSELRIGEAGASEEAAEKKGRGGTLTRLHCTELAFWEYAGATLTGILASIPDDPEIAAEVLIESTANGAAPDVPVEERDLKNAAGSAIFHWRYLDARGGKSDYRAHFFEWWQTDEYRRPLAANEDLTPGDDAERFLESHGVGEEQRNWRRAKIRERGLNTFRQEYPSDDETCFLLSGASFFDAEVTEQLLHRARDPARRARIKRTGADGELRVWFEPQPGCEYIIAADTSEGVGGDPCAAHVYERRTGRHMATLDGQLKPWEFARELAALGRHYFGALIAVERNNHGHTVLRCLDAEQHYQRIFADGDERPGWLTSPATRAPALDTLEEAHRTGAWSTYDKAILGEMRTFVKNEKGRPEAARGAHDEHPMTAMIGWDVLTRVGVGRSFAGVEAF